MVGSPEVIVSMDYEIQISEQDLPVLSAVANKALALMRNENVTNQQLEELIKQDPALTQRVLHMSNTPFYAGRTESRTIMAAIARLGLRQLRNLIVMAASGELFDAADPIAQNLWDHSIASAIAGQILADHFKCTGTEEAFIASMLHDVGKLIIYRQVADDYGALLGAAQAGGRRMLQAENETFKYFDHCSVGALTVRKWRLPEGVTESIRFHHNLETAPPTNLTNPNLAAIVSLANVFANNLGHGRILCPWPAVGEMACARHLRLDLAQTEALAGKVSLAIEAQHALRP